MTTATRSRTATRPQGQTRTDTDGNTPAPQAEQPPRPAIWLQVVTASGSTQPVGIAIDAPDWETALDNAIMQAKLFVMREQLAAARKG